MLEAVTSGNGYPLKLSPPAGHRARQPRLARGICLTHSVILMACLLACAPLDGRSKGPAAAGGVHATSGAALAPTDSPAPTVDALRIIYSGTGGSYIPLWVAADGGYFREQTLDAELLLIESGTLATQTLVAGEAPLANIAAAAVLGAMVEGFDAAFVQATVNVSPQALFVRNDLAVPAGLRGGRVGITRFGSSTDVIARLLLGRWGLDPERDVTLLQVGSVPDVLAALQTGAVDAGMLADPTSLQAMKLGLRSAADAAELGIPYLHLGTVAPRAVIGSRPDLVRRYLLAYQAGLDRFFADAAVSEQVLAKYTHQDDPEVLHGTYQVYAEKYISQDVRPRPETLAPILATASSPRAREVAPESLIDDLPVRQLQADGLLPIRR